MMHQMHTIKTSYLIPLIRHPQNFRIKQPTASCIKEENVNYGHVGQRIYSQAYKSSVLSTSIHFKTTLETQQMRDTHRKLLMLH